MLLISVPASPGPRCRTTCTIDLLAGLGAGRHGAAGVSPRATPGAYLTISAGSRATSDPLVDGQQLALGEQAAGSSAGDVFERRTGVEPDGRYVALAWPTLERVNARQPYDAALGLLTDTLDDAGLGVEAIGNADGTDTVGTSYERQVGLARPPTAVLIPARRAGRRPADRDPSRPFGQRLDLDQVIQRFERAWDRRRDGGLVVVEAWTWPARCATGTGSTWPATRSCAARPGGHRRPRGPPARPRRPQARHRPDGRPYNLPNDRNLTVAALQGPGLEPGYLRSASTQRSVPDPGGRGSHAARPAGRGSAGRHGGPPGRGGGVHASSNTGSTGWWH